MSLKKIAIIGRPNVGKSTLFNILTETRKAVVKDQPGVTRDILIEKAEVWGREFEVVDTGGLTETQDTFSPLIREQVLGFLNSVDMLIVVMDGRVGLCPEDRDLIRIAKETGLDFTIAVNKLDKAHEESLLLSDFFEFGIEPIACSFENRRGITQVLEWIHPRISEEKESKEQGIVLAMVGKPNVGKSSLCNHLLGQNRMLVSDVAGTTIDSVDALFSYEGRTYTLVDTAGLRKQARRTDGLEILSAIKSTQSIRRANVVLLVIDGTQGPSEQDAKILNTILEAHKGVVLVANKLDIAREQIPEYRKRFREKLEQEFHFFEDIPLVFTSALTGSGIKDLFETIQEVYKKLTFRISTSELNDFFFEVIRKAPAPVYGTKNVKFFYLTQTFQVPPSFIAFVNFPDGVDTAYRRFLSKQIKERWNLEGIPIRIFAMKRGES